MTRLNDWVGEATRDFPAGAIRACTDVTGFGLIGHATEIAAASNVTMAIESAALPVLAGALDLVVEFLPCGGRANLRHYKSLEIGPSVDPERHLIALDPQTSGGLLLAVDVAQAEDLFRWLTERGVHAARIGRVEPADPAGIRVRLR
jgi:selenide,water dikinase